MLLVKRVNTITIHQKYPFTVVNTEKKTNKSNNIVKLTTYQYLEQ